MDEDKRIVRQVLGGDIDAFEELVHKYSQPVFETVARRVPRIDTDVVCQSVFISAFQSLHTYAERKPFENWLRRIARRRCCDYWRKLQTNKQQVNRIYEQDEENWFENVCADSAHRVYQRKLEQEDSAEMLHWALSKLSAEDRALVECIYFEDLPFKEVADTFDWSLANVKVRAHRARNKLRTIIEEQFDPEQV